MTELLVTPKSLSHLETLIDIGAMHLSLVNKIWVKITRRV